MRITNKLRCLVGYAVAASGLVLGSCTVFAPPVKSPEASLPFQCQDTYG